MITTGPEPIFRCNQCYRRKQRSDFPRGGMHECTSCARRKIMGLRVGRAPDFDALRELRVLWVPRSNVQKLGPIPSSTTSGYTCPTACPLRGNGCYAEFGHGGSQWRKLSRGERGIAWPAFLEHVAALPADQLWRHNLAGDLPGAGNTISAPRMLELVDANAGRRGFTFTHKPVATRNRNASLVAIANERGFAVNLSADTLEEADAMAGLAIGPVVVTVAMDAPKMQHTPQGRLVVVCPAQTSTQSCSTCGLCAKIDRKPIVGFRAHGQMAASVSARVMPSNSLTTRRSAGPYQPPDPSTILA